MCHVNRRVSSITPVLLGMKSNFVPNRPKRRNFVLLVKGVFLAT